LDELGRFDFPALIDYVLCVTGRPKLAYIGHSQGNAQVKRTIIKKILHMIKNAVPLLLH